MYSKFLVVFLVLLFSCKEEENKTIDKSMIEVCNSELIDSLKNSPSDTSATKLKSINYIEVSLECEYDRVEAISSIYHHLGLLDSADKWSLSGLALAKKNKDTTKILDFLIDHAFIKGKKIETDIALDLLNQAIEIDNITDYKKSHEIYDCIAFCYFIKKDFPTSKKFFNKSVNIILKNNATDSVLLYKIFTKKSFYLSNEGKYDSAINSTYKAISYLKNDDFESLGIAYQSIGGAYSMIEKYGLAKKYLDSSYLYNVKAKVPTTTTKYNFGMLYKKQKKYKQAEVYFYDSYLEAKRLNDLNYCLKGLGQLVDMNRKIGNYEKALNYFLIANEENERYDSIHKEEQLQEFKVKYDVQLKEEQNKSLKLENDLTKKSAKNRTLIFLLIIFVFLLLGVLALLRFRQFSFKRKLEQVQLEQKLLRSQMSPHFIFNSISNIHSLILSKNNKDAAKYLAKFSKLLRLMLENSRDQFVDLENEIIALDNYIDLQKLRFKDKFDHVINIDPNINTSEVQIPPMLIQPFVENSIEHGIRNIDYKGFIKIDIVKAKNSQSLLCTIDDNGVGISKSKAPRHPQKGKSLSTQITKERLVIFGEKFKTRAELEISPKSKETGTLIKIFIPYIT